MSTQETAVSKAVNPQLEGTPPDAGAPKLTLTQYQQLADSLSADLDAFLAKMPTIEQTPMLAALLKANRSVPTPAIGNAIAAVVSSPALQSTKQLDVDAAREVVQFIEAFRPIETKLLGIANQLHIAIEGKRATIADGVRKVYTVLKGLTFNRPGDPLEKHAEKMKRDFSHTPPKPKATDQKGGTPTTGTQK